MAGVNVMTGVQLSASFVDSFGITLSTEDLGKLIEVTWNAKSQVLISEPIDNNGEPEVYRQPGTWSADFTFDRNGSNLLALVIAHDEDYYQGNPQRTWDVYVTVINPDGSVTQLQFVRGVFHTENSGPWTKTALVKEKFSMEFARVHQVDSLGNPINVA